MFQQLNHLLIFSYFPIFEINFPPTDHLFPGKRGKQKRQTLPLSSTSSSIYRSMNYCARKYKILLLVFIQQPPKKKKKIRDSVFISNNTPEIILIYRVKVVLTRNSGHFSHNQFGQIRSFLRTTGRTEKELAQKQLFFYTEYKQADIQTRVSKLNSRRKLTTSFVNFSQFFTRSNIVADEDEFLYRSTHTHTHEYDSFPFLGEKIVTFSS